VGQVDRQEWERLRDLQGKTINGDIKLESNSKTSPLFVAKVPIANAHEIDLVLNVTYRSYDNGVTFNFSAEKRPICRLDVRGTNHKDQGRTHKHELTTEADSNPRRNLPVAYARPEFETLSAKDAWKKLCEIAKIDHKGTFDPTGVTT
jgi:hypothetical protein